MSLQSAALLLLAASSASAYTLSPLTYHTAAFNHTCQIQPTVIACENKTAVQDSCCSAATSLGLVTQFWDTYTGYESQGQILPKGEWSVHGLWPDFCDGTYPQYCDLNRQYDPYPSPNTTNGLPNGTVVPAFTGGDIVTPTLEFFGKYDLLAWMKKYWVAQNQNNYIFWQHEFSKHATCFSTFDIPCYGPLYTQGQDLVDFFSTAAAYQLQYPTYDWLSSAGITPSNSTTYTLQQLQDALTKASGAVPYLGCSGNRTANGDGRTVLTEIWYYNHAIGPVQSGQFKPVDQTGKSSCSPSAGIWYYQRTAGSEA